MSELFPAGTFTPDPRPSTVARMLAAQYNLAPMVQQLDQMIAAINKAQGEAAAIVAVADATAEAIRKIAEAIRQPGGQDVARRVHVAVPPGAAALVARASPQRNRAPSRRSLSTLPHALQRALGRRGHGTSQVVLHSVTGQELTADIGYAEKLVMQALSETRATPAEMEEIRKLLAVKKR